MEFRGGSQSFLKEDRKSRPRQRDDSECLWKRKEMEIASHVFEGMQVYKAAFLANT